MSLYAGIVDRLDQNVGRVVKKLEDIGQLDNTLLIFVSDNGGTKETGMFGINGHKAGVANYDQWARKGGWSSSYGQGWANLSNVPFRLYKRHNHEGGVSTPLIMHWPERIKTKGTITHQVGHLVDIMATCVDAAGADYPEHFAKNRIQPMEGKSLLPMLEGEDLGKRILYWEHEGNRAIRDGKWKLVALNKRPWELYDMSRDRTELENLAQTSPEVAAQLSAKWDSWAKRAGVRSPAEIQELRRKNRGKTLGTNQPRIKVDPNNLATQARSRFSSSLVGRDHDDSIRDGVVPTKSADKRSPHRSWWPHKGNQQWAQYDFSSVQEVDRVEVFWFHDSPNGGCKVPASWRVLYREDEKWKPVGTLNEPGTQPDRFNELRFRPVNTTALRIEVSLQPGFSGGIHEWRVTKP